MNLPPGNNYRIRHGILYFFISHLKNSKFSTWQQYSSGCFWTSSRETCIIILWKDNLAPIVIKWQDGRALCLWGTYRSHRRFDCSCRWTDCRHSSGYHWCSCRCPWNMAQNLIKIHQIAMSLFLIDVMRYKNFAFNQKLKECDLRFYFHFTINQTSIGFWYS